MRYLDKTQRNQIGFDYIISSLETMTAMGRELAIKAEPQGIKKISLLQSELDNLELIIDGLYKNTSAKDAIESTFCKLNDIRKTIGRLGSSYVLDEVELFEIKHFAKSVTALKTYYDMADIEITNIVLWNLTELFKLLDPENTGILTFHIYAKYSSELAAVREEKRLLEQQISIEKNDKTKEEMLAKRLTYVVSEDKEEQKIKKDLTKQISQYKAKLEQSIKSIGQLDFYMAKAKLAVQYNCVKPSINSGNALVLEDASNPMVAAALAKKSKSFTPISVKMKQGVTILTGANMGGKSVTMKTIVLNVMLAQSGFFVFATKATMPAYDYIYYISDDMQSVEKGLSTFGAEILALKTITGASRVTDGFIALDEPARGTNPREGRDIVQAIIIFLKTKASHSFISSHYDGVATDDVKHYQVIGLRDADYVALGYKVALYKNKAVDIIQEHMDYRIQEIKANKEVPKDALNIAKLLGLDEEIVETIENFYR